LQRGGETRESITAFLGAIWAIPASQVKSGSTQQHNRRPMSAISTIRNLGPATEAQFAKAGITTAEDLRQMGPDAAYRAWLMAGLPAHFIGYYVLVMALQDRPWNDCKGDEKKALRVRFDALKAECNTTQRSALETALNYFGVIAPPKPPRP
jgi:hypothetical protein